MKTLKCKYFFLLLFLICVIWGSGLSAQQKLKIISYNILKGMMRDTTQGKEAFIEWVKTQNPDILAIQEANKFTQKSLEEMAHKFNHPYAILLREDNFPVAITSKYPIINVHRVIDNMAHGFITANIKGYNIIALHLSPGQYLKRREEIEVILQTIASKPSQKKWIIMGDFNSFSPLDKENYTNGKEILKMQEKGKIDNLIDRKYIDYNVQQKILDFGLVDIVKKLSDTDRLPRRIDYIYVSKDLVNNILRAEFLKDTFTKSHSDHIPIIMEIEEEKLKN